MDSIAETNATHVFLVRNGEVATSRVVACPGGNHARDRAGDLRREKIPCARNGSDADDVYGADEVFCTGTMGELAGVTQIDDRTIGEGNIGPMTKRLSDLYAQRTRELKA